MFGRKACQKLGWQFLRSACERVGRKVERCTDGIRGSLLGLSDVIGKQGLDAERIEFRLHPRWIQKQEIGRFPLSSTTQMRDGMAQAVAVL